MEHIAQKEIDPLDWFLREPSEEAEARVFLLPYSGCGASMYRLWPESIGRIELCPVQLPGRENRLREPHFGTYEALADELAFALESYLDRPYAFFGHCGSALPGYETSVRIVEKGLPAPWRLFVSSQVAPHEGPQGRFLSMNDEELRKEMEILMRSMGGTPLTDLIELYFMVLRRDIEANKQYRKETPFRLPCPITALGWDRDLEVQPEQMKGWQDCGETTYHLLAGEHYSFLQAPQELLICIEKEMEAILAPISSR